MPRQLPDRLEDLRNVGPAFAADLRLLGIERPADLVGKDPRALFDALCRKTGTRQDPCVLDTFTAVVAFATTGEDHPWWHYSRLRKAAGG
ncbi:MAG: helix-hairpin-helix domain-containing protein [Candidatus Sumerlaeia bacterium]|nr:helix-hairpin-helix domain-containing protein [Candidatus Sumerlaeia bacterium]